MKKARRSKGAGRLRDQFVAIKEARESLKKS